MTNNVQELIINVECEESDTKPVLLEFARGLVSKIDADSVDRQIVVGPVVVMSGGKMSFSIAAKSPDGFWVVEIPAFDNIFDLLFRMLAEVRPRLAVRFSKPEDSMTALCREMWPDWVEPEE